LARKGVSPTWLNDIVRGNAGLHASVTLDFWSDFIAKQARARYVISKAAKAIDAIASGKHPDDAAYELAHDLKESAGAAQKARTRSLGEIMADEGYPAMLEWMQDPKHLAGPSTGLKGLDIYLGGYGPGRLIAIGADTGIGKSAFVQHTARELSTEGVPVHIVSTEMADLEVFFRMAFMEAGWDKLGVAKRGHVRDDERDAMLDGLDSLANRPVYLTELRGMTVDALEAEVHRVREQFGTKVVILDLLNGLPTVTDNRAQGIAQNTQRLKQMAEAERVCLLMTAHINRESAKGISELGLHSFKDSGAIEQDADQALILVPVGADGARLPREEVTQIVNLSRPVDVAIRICKNRHGAEGTVQTKLNWGHGGRFYPAGVSA
jgi:replicative DNA helicase